MPINTDNASQLELRWSCHLESTRDDQATSPVVDGIMQEIASWSGVHAIAARTGKRIWSFDRSVALYQGLVFVPAHEGHGRRRSAEHLPVSNPG